ncbi:MAG: DUF937 domain-containing protein [Hyphomicrobiales bacterium]|nr:DUF937 domain-containing protein [Hyphomicrobiales bacterium]
MGLFDELGAGVPGGNVSKPLMIALAALLASRAMGKGGLGSMLGGGSSAPVGQRPAAPGGPQVQPDAPQAQQPSFDGGLVGGLGGLLDQFRQKGLGGIVGSWVGPGDNQPVSPQEVHQALGPDIIDQLSQRSGIPRDQLLSELSRVLPNLVDRLTPSGRVPSNAELAQSMQTR